MAQSSSMSKEEHQPAGPETRNKGQDLADKAKETAASVGQAASNVASKIGDKAEQATGAVGSGMESLGSTIREHGPQSGVLGSASSAMAHSLESGGRYLREEGLSGMGRDFTNLIRQNPIPAVLIGFGVGFLLARVTRS